MREFRTPRAVPAGSGDDTDTIGTVLARARTERGVTQLRLAEWLCAASGAATVTRHEISRWEREERLPSGFWLGWLAFVLDLPVGDLEQAVTAARRRRLRAGATTHPGWRRVRPGVYEARAC
jgi:transcriptional regulator with XRE-family HTH domain